MKTAQPLYGCILSRRAFVRDTVAATLVTVTSNAPTQNSEPPKADGLSPSDWEEVQSRRAILLRVYGERLSAREKERVLDILTPMSGCSSPSVSSSFRTAMPQL